LKKQAPTIVGACFICDPLLCRCVERTVGQVPTFTLGGQKSDKMAIKVSTGKNQGRKDIGVGLVKVKLWRNAGD
jgi:hypothetical protein